MSLSPSCCVTSAPPAPVTDSRSSLNSLQRLLADLDNAGIVVAEREVAEALWLAVHMTQTDVRQTLPVATRGSPGSIAGQDTRWGPPLGEPPLVGQGASRSDIVELSHPGQTGSSGTPTGKDALPIRLAAPREIHQPLPLLRALRPLKRTVASKVVSVVDEEATATQSAETASIFPVLTPASERWLNLTLVVDASPSMVLWEQLVGEIHELLQQLGAFRDIRLWYLRSDNGMLGIHPNSVGRTMRSTQELVDPVGRQAILLLSDCVGHIWRTGAAMSPLRSWAHAGPLAILQPLPQRLWPRSAIALFDVLLHSPVPGLPNRQLVVHPSDATSTDPLPAGIPIPLLQIEPDWLSSWARLVSGTADEGVHGTVTFTTAGPTELVEKDLLPDADAVRLVEHFMAGASPEAFKLAGYLAAAPLSLPLMRLVQNVMLDQPRPSQLAEVFLSGLLVRASPSDLHAPVGTPQFAYWPGVRDVLLGTIRRSEAIRVVELVSANLRTQIGDASTGFTAYLGTTPGTTGRALTSTNEPYAAIEADVLNRIGGRYAEAAAVGMSAHPAAMDTLSVDRSHPVRLPLPGRRLQDYGLYMWTAADFQAVRQGRLPDLRREFTSLAPVFDTWLTSGPSFEGDVERLRVLWLVGDPGPERSRGLLACLARAARQGRAIYDAGTHLSLAANALSQSIVGDDSALPPVIGVSLEADQLANPWTVVKSAMVNATRQFSAQHGKHLREIDPYPRMIVAGTAEQEQAALEVLAEFVDFTSYSLYEPSETFSRERVFNRGLPITIPSLFGRQQEVAFLGQAWVSEQIRIVAIVAYGGTGKSALVNAWLHEMRESDYRGAQKVLVWSFYSQGTRENLVSADPFVNSALTWLGDDSAISLNPWAKGLRLASLIKQHRFLLVLDGMEPLQYPIRAPHVGGQLTDDSIRALLEELAKPDWDGLCLITTRVPLTDLGRFHDNGTVVQLDLENLNDRDGADLLRYLIRMDADSRELQQAVQEVDGHALAITMLGNYLRDLYGGDLAGRFSLEPLTVDVREGGHARRIMESYSQWLDRHERWGQLAILRLIGLFDRPAAPDAIEALLTDIRMAPFTGQLEHVGSVWDSSVSALRAMGLLNREVPELPGTLDAHPLTREHFRDQVRRNHEALWEQGNSTLFDYYRGKAPYQPSDSAEMNLLYAAVTHGCAAGLHQKVFDEVLLPRVWRDRRTNFSTRRIGMTGSDLVALSNYFYPRQWTELLAPALSSRSRVLVLTNAGVRLRQLGRLVDARDCFGAVVREIHPQAVPTEEVAVVRNTNPEAARAEELEDAAYAAAQYCELLVIAGKLVDDAEESGGALYNGIRAVEYSDRGGDPYFSMHARSSLAEVYFMLNDLTQAATLFEEARDIERERSPRPPFLYSQSLFRYGYFLIETNRAERILSEEAQDPSWGKNGEDSSLLSEAIRFLILGAARRSLIESGNREPALLNTAENYIDQSIDAFRIAGYADYTVRGLLERANFYSTLHNVDYYGKALADLAQATAEAQRGQMDLLYADILLQQCACHLAAWPTVTKSERSSIRGMISDDLAEAARLVSVIGYRRRFSMLAHLQEDAAKVGAHLS
jgi:tetratricopeptide (TPR) repeat protein